MSDELKLGFGCSRILVVSATPIIEPLKVFRFPVGRSTLELKAIQQPLRLLLCPTGVEKGHCAARFDSACASFG